MAQRAKLTIITITKPVKNRFHYCFRELLVVYFREIALYKTENQFRTNLDVIFEP
jgi:hypothetical protein